VLGELGPVCPTSLYVRSKELSIVRHRQKSSVGPRIG
jgi:hypothetical protein